MATKVKKKYTVADVYAEAANLLRDEMQGLKRRPLSKSEEIKMKQVGKALSKMVLKEMNIV
ncbi:MAG: hypothetical protein HQ596_04710 [Candidatus Saganbacteria bacterium]|nr:hypothetical protein [Candidatus Saganbacteria bacterium]